VAPGKGSCIRFAFEKSRVAPLLETVIPRDFMSYVAGGRGARTYRRTCPAATGLNRIEAGTLGWLDGFPYPHTRSMHLILWFSAFGLSRNGVMKPVPPFSRGAGAQFHRSATLAGQQEACQEGRGETTFPGISNSTRSQGFCSKLLIRLSKIAELSFSKQPITDVQEPWRPDAILSVIVPTEDGWDGWLGQYQPDFT
jgi:hypothetical protein